MKRKLFIIITAIVVGTFGLTTVACARSFIGVAAAYDYIKQVSEDRMRFRHRNTLSVTRIDVMNNRIFVLFDAEYLLKMDERKQFFGEMGANGVSQLILGWTDDSRLMDRESPGTVLCYRGGEHEYYERHMLFREPMHINGDFQIPDMVEVELPVRYLHEDLRNNWTGRLYYYVEAFGFYTDGFIDYRSCREDFHWVSGECVLSVDEDDKLDYVPWWRFNFIEAGGSLDWLFEMEVELEPEPEPEAEPEPEVRFEPETELGPEPEPMSGPELIDMEVEPDVAEPITRAFLEPEIELILEPEPEVEPEMESELEPELEPEFEVEPEAPEPEIWVEPEEEPEPEPEIEPEVKPELKPEPETEPEPEPIPEPIFSEVPLVHEAETIEREPMIELAAVVAVSEIGHGDGGAKSGALIETAPIKTVLTEVATADLVIKVPNTGYKNQEKRWEFLVWPVVGAVILAFWWFWPYKWLKKVKKSMKKSLTFFARCDKMVTV